MGFVAILGVISLIGMVIRNSVILIDQIDDRHRRTASTRGTRSSARPQHRLRPILLTAAAAILGMIPIAPTVFWGPMAYAVMGGLVVATLLTLVFLPALYVAWFRIQPAGAGACRRGGSGRSRRYGASGGRVIRRSAGRSGGDDFRRIAIRSALRIWRRT